MKVVYAPNTYDITNQYSIFLAGSIEMGKAENWQEMVIKELENFNKLTILNPRRIDWNGNWKQSIHNRQFNEQVRWEINGIYNVDLVVMYFDPQTMSPITLLEFGLCVGSDKDMVICCPDGFWRRGNLEILCDMQLIYLNDNINDFLAEIKDNIK